MPTVGARKEHAPLRRSEEAGRRRGRRRSRAGGRQGGRRRAGPRSPSRDVAAGAQGPSASGAAVGPASRRVSPPGSKMATAAAGSAGAAAALWSEVNRCGQNGDFSRALKAVNKSECGHKYRCPVGAGPCRAAGPHAARRGLCAGWARGRSRRPCSPSPASNLSPPWRAWSCAEALRRGQGCGGEERAGSGSGARAKGGQRRFGTFRGFSTVKPRGETRSRRGWAGGGWGCSCTGTVGCFWANPSVFLGVLLQL